MIFHRFPIKNGMVFQFETSTFTKRSGICSYVLRGLRRSPTMASWQGTGDVQNLGGAVRTGEQNGTANNYGITMEYIYSLMNDISIINEYDLWFMNDKQLWFMIGL